MRRRRFFPVWATSNSADWTLHGPLHGTCALYGREQHTVLSGSHRIRTKTYAGPRSDERTWIVAAPERRNLRPRPSGLSLGPRVSATSLSNSSRSTSVSSSLRSVCSSLLSTVVIGHTARRARHGSSDGWDSSLCSACSVRARPARHGERPGAQVAESNATNN